MTPRDLRAIAWRTMRAGAPPSLDADDLVQIGHLAMLEAERAGRVPADPLHRARYLRRRATGAMRDACRVEQRQTHGQCAENAVPEAECVAPGPERTASARCDAQIAAHRITPRMMQSAQLVAAGMGYAEAGRVLGVTKTTVRGAMQRAKVLAASPPPSPAERTHPHSVRLTDAHWAAYQALGGHAWLARQIEAAAPQVVDPQGETAIANPSSRVRLPVAPPENT